MSRIPVALLTGLAAVLLQGVAAGPAEAFCRSTTCTGDCPRDEDECKTSGKDLFWKTACVGYSLHEDGTINIPMKHVRPAIARSFAAWVDQECDDGGFSTMSFAELDDVSCHRTEYNPSGTNANIVLFQDTKWAYASSDNNLAKTTVTFDEDTGEILDADIEINHAYNFYTISDENVEYDLVSVMTHEVGHLIGLDHSADATATMNATYDRGSIDLRTLEPDDAQGACAAYPSDRDAACDTDPKGGLGQTCGGEATAAPDEAVDEGCAVSVAGVGGTGGGAAASLGALAALGLWAARRRRTARGGVTSRRFT